MQCLTYEPDSVGNNNVSYGNYRMTLKLLQWHIARELLTHHFDDIVKSLNDFNPDDLVIFKQFMVSLLTMANHFCNLQSGPTQHNIHQDIQSHDFQLTDDCIERFKAFDDALDRSIITESDNQPAAILRRPIRFDPTLPLLRFTLNS